MGTLNWLVKKVTQVFSRSTNALFYSLLYREILKEINDITKDEGESIVILKEIGKKSGIESCERHSSIFKFMPGSPKRVLDYFEILFSLTLGMDMGEYSCEEILKEGSRYNDYIITIKKCPLCGGYGTDKEDTFDFEKIIASDSEGMACGLCGMLESVANYILRIKRNDYRIGIVEQKCFTKGDECLQFTCKIYDIIEWKKTAASRGTVEEDVIQETKFDVIDKLQDVLSLDKLEELFEEPLESVKEKLAEIIRDKLNMEPEHFLDYFRNYEDDMIRIIGFLAVHLLNEYGGLVEKFLKKDLFAKVAGYIFKQLKQMVLLFLPLDVINDYHELLVNFLDGLAPAEMVENIKQYSGKDDITFIFEGAQMALENLGIDFSELKENIWEEMRKEREDGLVSAEPSMVDRTQEKIPKIINIIQEILMLVSEFLTLPVRMLISESHYGIKTAINSVVSEEEGLVGSVRTRIDTIFDLVQEIRK